MSTQALAPQEVQRLERLRCFMRAHGITYSDIADQFEDSVLNLADPRNIDYYAAQSMLRKLTLEKPFRDRLLELDFPVCTLPAERQYNAHTAKK